MTEITYDVNSSNFDSGYVLGLFENGKSILENEGLKIISAEENVMLRIQEGKKAFISKNGNWIREGLISVPNEKYEYFTKSSPIMENPVEATAENINRKEFYITNEQLDKAISNSVKIPFGLEPIPTKRFGDNKITVFIFGDYAQDYGEFLKDSGINSLERIGIVFRSVYSSEKDNNDSKNKPFARQIFFHGINKKSELLGYPNIGYKFITRGILDLEDKLIKED